MEIKNVVKVSRREFVKTTALASAVLASYRLSLRSAMALPVYNSPPLTLFNTTLRGVTGPEGIPVAASDGFRYWQFGNVFRARPFIGSFEKATHYTINIGEFTDALYPGFNTTLWGYHPQNILVGSTQPRHLGGIIIGRKDQPVQITFRNNLPPTHILPVDTTIPGAMQAQNRTAVHLHGGLVPWISDGGPHDWWAPDGTHGLSFLNNAVLNPKTLFNPGAALNEADYYYPMGQSARFVWYHDHAWGITRLNAYAGVATALIIRDAFEDFLVAKKGLPPYIETGGAEIPLVIQDKVFYDPAYLTDPSKPGPLIKGSLWYPYTYADPDPAPNPLPAISAVPEMFGDTMLVNGTVYPSVPVQAKRYRLRVLNACSSRFLNLQLYVADTTPDGITLDALRNPVNLKGPDFLVIGTEGGFLPKPVLVSSGTPFNPLTLKGSLITGCAERWDIIIDFSGFANKKLMLYNDAPAPFPGGADDTDFFPDIFQPSPGSSEATGPNTRVLMRFVVGDPLPAEPALGFGHGSDFDAMAKANGLVWNDPLLALPADAPVAPAGVYVRKLTLNETVDTYGRLIQLLGTDIAVTGTDYGREYMAPATEIVEANTTEIWEIANLTGDTHPMHFHLVNVQILNRQKFDSYDGGIANFGVNPIVPPDPNELGWKETVRMNPDTITRVIMKFTLPKVPFAVPNSPRTGGHEYVWHCHILEHEEHDMMRPLVVLGGKLAVNPPVWAILSALGGQITYQVQNAVLPLTITPSVTPSATTFTLKDNGDGTFTVKVPKNAPGLTKPGLTVTFTVTDSSPRLPANRTDTAKLIITKLI
jgi:spore coat protein A